jgi:hypothetical protein
MFIVKALASSLQVCGKIHRKMHQAPVNLVKYFTEKGVRHHYKTAIKHHNFFSHDLQHIENFSATLSD